ncbi:cupin domain-containing protein [Persicobacter diffluens]|uniref:Cupin n=1 Tax=Persicobacter diffluens TaxID=981 RepID=A0AAN4W1G3_9BACT|nr:cupin [Persicobacter diffluens]
MEAKLIKKQEGRKLNVIGDQQTIKLTGKDTNGQFALVEQFNVPGAGIPLHVHENEDEVFHVLSGQVEITINGETQIMEAGDMVFCPRGAAHAFVIVGEEKARVMLSIFPAGLENMFEELAQLPEGPPDFAKVTEICGRYQITFLPPE